MRQVYYRDSVGNAYEGWFHQWIMTSRPYAIVEKPDGGIVFVIPAAIVFKNTPSFVDHPPERRPETETSKIQLL